MRRMIAAVALASILISCTTPARPPASTGSDHQRSPTTGPSTNPVHCQAKVSSYALDFQVAPGVPSAVSDEIGQETRVARGAYPIRTPVCGHPRVLTVVSASARRAAAANTRSKGNGRFTIHVWTGGDPWRGAPEALRPLILLHEWYHVVQFSFLDCSRGNDACHTPAPLPGWLLEGSAQFEAEMIGGDMGIGGGFPERRAIEIRNAEPVSTPLRRLGTVTGAEYAVAFAAVDLLVARAGEGSLGRFWRLTAKTGAWRAAFRSAFGYTVPRFETAFELFRAAGYRT